MSTSPSPGATAPPPMQPYERTAAALCHLSTIIPGYALVANGLLYFAYRESSRIVCFHARQGINFQIMFLPAIIAWVFVHLFTRLIAMIGAPGFLVSLLDKMSDYALIALFAAYAAICLYGAASALRGRFFVYPIAGRRLYQNYLRSMNEW